MNAVIEKLASIETVLDAQGTHDASLAPRVPARLPLRQAKQRWCTALCDEDLQALLQILEVDLIPQLVNNYSPARHTPDQRLASG